MRWKLKVLIQFVLAHTPGGERINYRLQRASNSHSRSRIRSRILEAVESLAPVADRLAVEGKSIVEVGTGWDALQSVLLSVLGAREVVTYDHVAHVRWELVQNLLVELDDMAETVAGRLGTPPGPMRARVQSLRGESSLGAVWARAGIVYCAPGDATMTGLPNSCIDIFYSFAVLEHVPPATAVALFQESKRILKPGGLGFHVIGLGDHYRSVDSSLTNVNFLQYPEWIWRLFVKNRISYHNRLRERDFLTMLAAAGASVDHRLTFIDNSDVKVLETMKVDQGFEGYSPAELAAWRTEVLVTFPAMPRAGSVTT